jgi:DNA polymerase-3 subunit delta'
MAVDLKRLRELPWHATVWPQLQSLQARHHAILLHGQAGIGKKGLALDLAAALLCAAPRGDGHACGSCAECAFFETRNHPDLRIVVPDSLAWLRPEATEQQAEDAQPEAEEGAAKRASRSIGIDPVRAIAEVIDLTAHRAGHRVILLTPAEALTTEAANALLKMLEEPPPRTQFVLTSDRLDEVLPTIVSRCALLRVAPPPQAPAIEWLRKAGVGDPERALAAAGGAPLLAIDDASSALDEATRRLLLQALARGPQLDAIGTGARLPRTLAVAEAIALFQRWAWDLLALKSAGRVRYHPRERDVLARVGEKASVPALIGWIDTLQRARATAEHSLNPRLTVEALLLEYIACVSGPSAIGPA